VDSPFDYGRLDVFVKQRNTGLEPVTQGFMEKDNHDDVGFNGDAEARDVPDPHRYAEVVAEQPAE
jgi:hypothetical protein